MASLFTPSADRSLTMTAEVSAEVTSPSPPPRMFSAFSVTVPAPRSTRKAVPLSVIVRRSISASRPSYNRPTRLALWIVESATRRPVVVFSTTTPVRPPFTVSAVRTTLVESTCRNIPVGSSVVVTSCTVLLVVRLSSRPPSWSLDRVRLLITTLLWPDTDTP